MRRRWHLLWAMGCLGCFGGGGGSDSAAAGAAGGGGSAGGSEAGASGAQATRGEGVPDSWGAYCDEVGAIVCDRESACTGGVVADCTLGFKVGCCAAENACASSFGAGVSSDDYQRCLDDSGADECGAAAPTSCIALITEEPMPQPGRPTTLEEACAASCVAQEATNCPGVETASRCTRLCVELADAFVGCTDAWIDLNGCMAEAPLFCDTINGGAAVSSEDCGPEINAWIGC